MDTNYLKEDEQHLLAEAQASVQNKRAPINPYTVIEALVSLCECRKQLDAAESALAQERDKSAKATAYRILLTATSWGAALGAIAEGEPDVVKVVDEYTARVTATERDKVQGLREALEHLRARINPSHETRCRDTFDDLQIIDAALTR